MFDKTFAIIVTYNGELWIRNCLNSLISELSLNQIIIVDNCSSDQTCSIIETEYATCSLLKQDKNLGFGLANNLGIELAISLGAEFFLLLNQDAWLEKHTLANLQKTLSSEVELGLISPLHYNPSSETLDYLFSTYLDNKVESRGALTLVPFVNAAIWLVPIATIKSIGGFDPIFPHYGEDRDYVNRCLYHGMKIGVLCDQKGYHDRDSEALPSIRKRKYFEYINALVELKNINSDFLKSLITNTYKIMRYTISSIIRANWSDANTDLINLTKIWSSIRKIRTHRSLSKAKGSVFLNLK
ncbi:glycosyltransferase family 2 protein [Reichenbachiella sp.]|uniref:glycosyltransferase family 2 protein n=1 Tax=Reichenbachiella sp. TaxID=2184521 RepID=UPI003B58BBE1